MPAMPALNSTNLSMKKTNGYSLLVKSLTVIIALCALATSFSVINLKGVVIEIEWNMFKSSLLFPLLFIVIIVNVWVGIISADIHKNKFIKPLIPIVVAVVIYYTLMLILSFAAALLPDLLALVIISSVYFYNKQAMKLASNPKRYILIFALTIISLSAFYFINYWWSSNYKASIS